MHGRVFVVFLALSESIPSLPRRVLCLEESQEEVRDVEHLGFVVLVI